MSIQTPFYYYDLELLDSTLSQLKKGISGRNFQVHYAMKANSERRILEMIKSYGLGMDCVSGGEIQHALNSGFSGKDIVYAGVGKTDKELKLAIGRDVHGINCESIEELEVINEIARSLDRKANVFLRLNPNIDAKTHPNITTGTKKNKFGIPISDVWLALEALDKCENLKFSGLHFHIGSQIQNFTPFVELCEEINKIQVALLDRGYRPSHLNVGGGLGIDYENPQKNLIPDFKSYFDTFDKHLYPFKDQKVHFELGRSIVGQMGSLFSRVLYVKQTKEIQFALIDAGMTELMRPALYHASHKIENVSSDLPTESYEVVGPICESTDTFGSNTLNHVKRGNMIKIWSVGAYGSVLSSNYNMRDKPQAVFSDESRAVEFNELFHEKALSK